MQFYSAGFDGTASTRGMGIYADLMAAAKSLGIIRPLVLTLTSQDSAVATAAALQSAMEEVRPHFKVSSRFCELHFVRAITEALKSKDLELLVQLLTEGSGSPLDAIMDIERKKELQKTNLSKAMVTILNSGPQPQDVAEHFDMLISFLRKSKDFKCLNHDYGVELKLMCAAAAALEPDCTDESLQEAEKAKATLLSNKQGPFYKPLTLFGAGVEFIGRLGAVFETVLKDKAAQPKGRGHFCGISEI